MIHTMRSQLTLGLCLLACQTGYVAAQETHHTFRFTNTIGSSKSFKSMVFSPDSRQLAIAVGAKIEFINVHEGRVAKQIDSGAFSIGYSQDGSKFYSISSHGAELIDARTGAKYPTNYKVEPGYLGFSLEEANGRLLIKSISPGSPVARSGLIQVGDEVIGYGEGREGDIKQLVGRSVEYVYKELAGRSGTYIRLDVLPSGKFGVDASEKHLLRRQPRRLVGNKYVFDALPAVDTRENLVWCIKNERHEFRNASTGQPVATLEPVDINLLGVYALAPDNSKFAIVAKVKDEPSKSALEVFDLETQERLFNRWLSKDSFLDVAFDASSSKVLVATWDTVEIADIEKKRFVARFNLGWTPPPAKRKKKNSDDEATLQGGGSSANIFPSIRAQVGILDNGDGIQRAPRNLVSKLDVSSKNLLATSAEEGNVQLWNMEGFPLKELPKDPKKEARELLFSPDGNWLAYYVDNMLHLVDVSAVE